MTNKNLFLLFIRKPLLEEPHMRIDIVREGKDQSIEFSAGTLVRITCAKEYNLNIKNANSTAKCVRGRWKPMTPECTLSKQKNHFSEITFNGK